MIRLICGSPWKIWPPSHCARRYQTKRNGDKDSLDTANTTAPMSSGYWALKVNPVAQNVGGYQVQNDQWCPIFVTYHKSEDISASTQYEDRFKSPKVMHYFTKSNRSLTSPDVQFFKKSALSDAHHLPLFVKKDDDEGISFYYVGDVRPDPDSFRGIHHAKRRRRQHARCHHGLDLRSAGERVVVRLFN